LIDLQLVKNICSSHRKAKEILKKVDGKRNYKEIAKLVGVHETTCSHILSKAHTFELLTKKGRFYKKTPEFRHINIDALLKGEPSTVVGMVRPTVRRRSKVIDLEAIKKSIREYLIHHFSAVSSPFSKTVVKLSKSDLQKAAEKLFEYLDTDVGLKQLEGLSLRFYDSFAAYFSCNRINKGELINAFSNMVKCFEPYVKKVASIKARDPKYTKMSLNTEVISRAASFSSDVNKHQDDYWNSKPVHEASIRLVFPFRHMEAHEARDYASFEMDRIVHYMFASIIFINLDY
jgi:hypothetical protein